MIVGRQKSVQHELRLAKARGQVEKLTPSLLARAFAGQLVPQDTTDEPASSLLARIMSTAETTAAKLPADDRGHRIIKRVN